MARGIPHSTDVRLDRVTRPATVQDRVRRLLIPLLAPLAVAGCGSETTPRAASGETRVTIADARVILAAVDRVERAHPALVGGCGVYPAASGHGPFVHVDTRGYRARWIGSGDD